MEIQGLGAFDPSRPTAEPRGERGRPADAAAPDGRGRAILADLFSARGMDQFRIRGGALRYIDPQITGAEGKVALKPGEVFAPEVEIESPAQRAEIALDMLQFNLNLGGPGDSDGSHEQFQLRIAGSQGSQILNFASGTVIDDMMNAINAFRDQTGVSAAISGTAITLQSQSFGSDEFVSVEILDDGDSTPPPVIVGGTEDNGVFTGRGEDVVGKIDGIRASGRGAFLSAEGANFSLQLRLADSVFDAWAGPVSFLAMKIEGVDPPVPQRSQSPPGFTRYA